MRVIILISLFCLHIFAAEEIKTDTVWNTDQKINTTIKISAASVSVSPGVHIEFGPEGRILMTHGSSLNLIGSEGKPIIVTGAQCGIIEGYGAALNIQFCELSGLGATSDKKTYAINLAGTSGKGIRIKNSSFSNCARLYLKTGGGDVEVTDSTFNGAAGAYRPHISSYGKGKVLIEGNSLDHADIGLNGEGDCIVKNNRVVSGSIGAWNTQSLLIEGNYVHQPAPNGSYCIPGANGIIRNNVFRGGSWTTAKITGTLSDNVIISLPHQGFNRPDVFDKNCTHEHICGMGSGSVVRRNIFIGASYGGVMGLGKNTCSALEFSNNTLDMKNAGRCVMTNHLPEAPSNDIKIRNNIFMRCTGVRDEAGVKNAISILDNNLWSEAPVSGERYEKVSINGKQNGDEGFGKNDLPAKGTQLSPKQVVNNPEFEFPMTDTEMLTNKHSVETVLKAYRNAYGLIKGSAAINAGQNISGDTVADGKFDIGAVEFVGQ